MLFFKVPFPRLEYTIPTRSIGEEAELVPDAPWTADINANQDLDLSDDEDSFFYMDSQDQKEAKAKKRAKKLKKLREGYFLTSVPLSYQALFENEIPEEEGM